MVLFNRYVAFWGDVYDMSVGLFGFMSKPIDVDCQSGEFILFI